jgi:Carboxypeptidase regulatory-like domain
MHRTIRNFATLTVLAAAATFAIMTLAPLSHAGPTIQSTTTHPAPPPSSPTASIWGNVTDAHGSPLGGATVKLLNEDTKVETGASTDGTGQYRFESLAPGNYNLTFTGSGMVAKQHKVRIKPGTKKVEVNERLKPPPEPDSK